MIVINIILIVISFLIGLLFLISFISDAIHYRSSVFIADSDLIRNNDKINHPKLMKDLKNGFLESLFKLIISLGNFAAMFNTLSCVL